VKRFFLASVVWKSSLSRSKAFTGLVSNVVRHPRTVLQSPHFATDVDIS